MAKEGWRVRVAVRRPNEAMFVRPYGVVGQVEPVLCNIRDDESVRLVMKGADAVVNCVGTFDKGGKSCCFITSNAQSEQLELLLQQQCPGIRVKRYHGDQTKIDENGLFHVDNKKADMADINNVAA
jgi:hypothetical protein